MAKIQRQKRKDGLRRQEQIMDVATVLFAEKGYHSTSIKEIIQTAGIAKGTFYLHFEGKFDLLETIVSSKIDILTESVKALDISRPEPISEIKKLYRNFTQLLIGIKNFRQLTCIILNESIYIDPGLASRVNNFFDSTIDMAARYIKTAQDMGRVQSHFNNEIAAKCIVGSTRELFYRWAVRNEDIDFNEALSNMLDLFLNGLLIERESN